VGVALSIQFELRRWPLASSICVGQMGEEGEGGFLSLSLAVGLLPPLSASAKGVKRSRDGFCVRQ
jgi:hypothetical protein